MPSTGFWWILLACAAYGLLHSILAAHFFKRAVMRVIGQPAYQRFYRLFFSALGALTALPVLALVALLPDQPIYTIPAPWRYLTLALQALALVGLLLGVLQTGALRFIGLSQALQSSRRPEPPEPLVVSGLYGWVRHPLYTFSLALLWLTPILTWNVLALNLGFSAYLLIGTIFEERKLVDQFGPAYETYRRQTPRILPRLKR